MGDRGSGMSVDYKQIGKQIRKYRKARGLTQEELAGAVDISPTHMSHIETAGTKLSLPVLLIFLAIGVVIGGVGGVNAIRNYLKV